MLKTCDSVVVEPLSLIFKNCIDSGIFPNLWKKSHIIPTHKKNDKRCINNYRPVSLLPICGKIFERIIYNPVYLCLENNDLLNPHQSGFRSNDSCIYQLLSIDHSIMQTLIIIHHLKLEVTFWISQKHLIKYGMKVSYINLNLLAYQVIFLNYSIVSLTIGIKE